MVGNKKVTVIGIAGGSCSGKTFFANVLQKTLTGKKITLISEDWYYYDQSHKFDYDGGAVNFDHPDSIDFSLLHKHLLDLIQQKSVKVPVYDYKTHTRVAATQELAAGEIILVDGSLILSQPRIYELLDYIVYLDISEEIRLQRRIKRDTEERGRELQGILQQFELHVKPMHALYIEAFKQKATYIVSTNEDCSKLVKILAEKINYPTASGRGSLFPD
jgi:uridine kinase